MNYSVFISLVGGTLHHLSSSEYFLSPPATIILLLAPTEIFSFLLPDFLINTNSFPFFITVLSF